MQVLYGDVQPWDSHTDIASGPAALGGLAGECDQGISAFLTDRDERRLLEEALVLCDSEFGRPLGRAGERQTGERPRPQPLGVQRLSQLTSHL